MPLPLRLGNDVVDLSHRRTRPGRDRTRLMDRILTPGERLWVAPEDEAWERRLWCTWAAKECGYKVACKWPGARPIFRHRDFESRLGLQPSEDGFHGVRGQVATPWGQLRISGWVSPSVVHLGGMGGDGHDGSPRMELGVERLPEAEAPALESLRGHFTDREWEGIHRLHSARARILARERLAGYLGLDDPRRIEIVTSAHRPGRTPPRLLLDGAPLAGWDLSISHHGAYVGWALLLP